MRKNKYIVLSIFTLLTIVLPILGLLIINFNYSSVSALINRFSNKIVPAEVQQFTDDYLQALRGGNIDGAISSMVEDSNFSRDNIALVSSYFKGLAIEDKIVINTEKTVTNNLVTYALSYEVVDKDQLMKTPYAIISVKIAEINSEPLVFSINVKPSAESVENVIRKGIADNMVKILIAFVLLCFIVYTTFLYIKNSSKPRWRIVALILLVNIHVAIDGTSLLFNVGFNSFVELSNFQIIANISVPLGAIIFWIRRKHIFEKESRINMVTNLSN